MQKLTFLSSIIVVNSLSIYPLIRDFTKRGHVSSITLFYCNSSESVGLVRMLSADFTGSMRGVESSKFVDQHLELMTAKHFRLGFVLDLDCPRAIELMSFCSSNDYFNASYRWLMISRKSIKSATNLLKKQNLNIDTRITLVVLGPHNNIYEVYGTISRRGGQLNVMQVGIWKEHGDIVWNCSSERYKVRSNFQGITLWSSVTVR